MNQETNDKIESIIISAVTRLFKKESISGLDYEDLRCLEILVKVKKDAENNTTSTIPVSTSSAPDNLVDLLRAVKGLSNESSE